MQFPIDSTEPKVCKIIRRICGNHLLQQRLRCCRVSLFREHIRQADRRIRVIWLKLQRPPVVRLTRIQIALLHLNITHPTSSLGIARIRLDRKLVLLLCLCMQPLIVRSMQRLSQFKMNSRKIWIQRQRLTQIPDRPC